MAQRRFILWLFPLALLLAQEGAFAHGISHIAGHAPDKARVIAADVCNQCIGFANLAHVASDAQTKVDSNRSGLTLRIEPVYRFVAVGTQPYRARGPPALL